MEFEFDFASYHQGKDTFCIYADDDGNTICRFYVNTEAAIDEMFRFISQIICFGDCSNEKIERICVKGKDVEYVGWQPHMLFEYADKKSGKIIWSCAFPQWEH